MQLPRGSFKTIKKHERLTSVLDEIERGKFSGISSISSNGFICTLVFYLGNCILAESQTDVGDAVWENVQRDGEIVIDAILSDLDLTQLQLSLDFNKTARVANGIRGAAPVKKLTSLLDAEDNKTPGRVPDEPWLVKEGIKEIQHVTHKPSAASPSLTRVVMKAAPQPDEAPPEELPSEQERVYRGLHKTAFEKDIDTFDTMDLGDMTEKIRRDCKIVVRQLQLDHLIEK